MTPTHKRKRATMNTHTTHTTHTTRTVASAPTLAEMRARKYAHAVDRNDSARRAHGHALACLAVAVLSFVGAVFVAVFSYVAGTDAFTFGNVGREITRASAWALVTGCAVLVGFVVRDARDASNNYKSARKARAHACAELLSTF